MHSPNFVKTLAHSQYRQCDNLSYNADSVITNHTECHLDFLVPERRSVRALQAPSAAVPLAGRQTLQLYVTEVCTTKLSISS